MFYGPRDPDEFDDFDAAFIAARAALGLPFTWRTDSDDPKASRIGKQVILDY